MDIKVRFITRLKKIFYFLNKHPIFYFIFFATYGWVIYIYNTSPVEMPFELQRPVMRQNLAIKLIEEGMYNRAKKYNADKCAEFKLFNESVFCKMGWHYYNYINLLEEHLLLTKKERLSSKKLFIINEFPKALALGGAIQNLNLDITEFPIEKKWLSYVEEGYGFFSTYFMFRNQLKYPLNLLCPSQINSNFCNFGVGQAARYLNYNKEELKYSALATKGAEFAAVFGAEGRAQNQTLIEQYASALISREKNKKNKLLKCTEKKHPIECF